MRNKVWIFLGLFLFIVGGFQEVNAQRRPRKEKVVAVVKPSTVELVYQDLPLGYLEQVQDYIEHLRKELPKIKTVDSKELRTAVVRNLDTARQYIHLQLPGESKYTRIQLYETGKRNKLVGLENTVCDNGYCKNGIKFYRKDSGNWVDVTASYKPEPDYKYMSSKLKAIYKKTFTGLDIYESKGYNDEVALKNSLMYIISPDENKILIQEPHLSTILYEMIWNQKKQEFELKKTK